MVVCSSAVGIRLFVRACYVLTFLSFVVCMLLRIMYGSRTDGRRKDQERKKKLFCVRGEKDGRANGNQSNLEIKLESLSNFDL